MITILYFSYAIALSWILYKWFRINKLHNTIFKTKEMNDEEIDTAGTILALMTLLTAFAIAVVGILCFKLNEKDRIIERQRTELYMQKKHVENQNAKYFRLEYQNPLGLRRGDK